MAWPLTLSCTPELPPQAVPACGWAGSSRSVAVDTLLRRQAGGWKALLASHSPQLAEAVLPCTLCAGGLAAGRRCLRPATPRCARQTHGSSPHRTKCRRQVRNGFAACCGQGGCSNLSLPLLSHCRCSANVQPASSCACYLSLPAVDMLVALPMPCPTSGSNSTEEAAAAGSAAGSAGAAPVPAGEAGEAADAPMLAAGEADGEAEIEPEPEPELCLVFLVDGSGAHLHHTPVRIPRPLPAGAELPPAWLTREHPVLVLVHVGRRQCD